MFLSASEYDRSLRRDGCLPILRLCTFKKGIDLLLDCFVEEGVGEVRVKHAAKLEGHRKIQSTGFRVRRQSRAEAPIADEMVEELAIGANGFD